MLPFYIGALIFGGILLAGSIFGGDDHDAGIHGAGHAPGDHGHGHGGVLPLLSLRFWAFSVAFFGLAGTVLTLAGLGALTPVVSGAFGLGSGYIAWRVLRSLAQSEVGIVPEGTTHVGREGRLLLPVAPGQRGKLRISVAGVSTDLLAETESADPLTAGETVLIVGMRDSVALVERSPGAPAEGKEKS